MAGVELRQVKRLSAEGAGGKSSPPLSPPNEAGNHVVGISPDKNYDDGFNHSPSHIVPTSPTSSSPSPPSSPSSPPTTAWITSEPAASSSKELNGCARSINSVQQAVVTFFRRHQTLLRRAVLIVLALLYLAYFAYALSYRFGDEGSIRLLVGTILAVVLIVIHLTWDTVMARLKGLAVFRLSPAKAFTVRRIIRWVLYVVSLVTMVTLLVVLVAMETPDNLVSLAGLAAFVLLAWVTSVNPAKVDWHPVFWGFSLQFYFACIILRTRGGYLAFKWLGDRISGFLSFSNEGAAFVFGENFRVHFFAFAIMSTVVFFSSVMSVLYYLGVMQKIISVMGRFLGFCMGTTPAESLCAAFNIFLGMTDTPLMVRPFLAKMTRSELHAIMTGGFATIAGSVLGAYIGFGVPANHLLSASVMSAPAALAISKLTYPETEPTAVQKQNYNIISRGTESNLIEAASAGASYSILLVGSILVNIIAFLSILKFVNATLTWFGERAGVENLTFQLICSYVLYPVSVLMGTELGLDCRRMGELVGIKTFTNEFIAYTALQKLLHNRQVWNNYTALYDVSNPANVAYNDMDVTLTQWGMVLEKGFLSPRSEVIATYALCGFSNFGSMGILLGAMGAMAPERRADMAAIVFRAMIAGNVACFFTACIAGLFYQEYD